MNKTNNFDELPFTNELWVVLDEELNIKLKVAFKDNKWYECIQEDDEPEVFIEAGDDLEIPYLDAAIAILEIYAKLTREEVTSFMSREVTFGFDNTLRDFVTIQTGPEGITKGDSEVTYPIDMIQIERKKWIELKDFFIKASCLYANYGNLKKGMEGDNEI